MNVDNYPPKAIDVGVWEQHEMRLALATRDLTAVYQRLQRIGISQRRIAGLTDQSPSEVYEILKGRKVMAYDVLVRIADGLGVPRGYLGLSYDPATQQALSLTTDNGSPPTSEAEEVRQLLSHAAQVTLGAAEPQGTKLRGPVEHHPTPTPRRIGHSDVEKIKAITAAMRALDYQHGGGACRDAVIAQAAWAQNLLGTDHSDSVAAELHVALADLHNLAGWISFDVGLYTSARRHFARALEQARHADDASLIANVLYRMGRLHLHRQWHRDALRFFQLGQLAAQDSGCDLTVAVLYANEAWAYAVMGDGARALKSIERAQDEFGRSESQATPPWVQFFGLADLHALIGVVQLALHETGHGALDSAIEALCRSIAIRGPDMARSQVFELTALATAHLVAGAVDQALPIANNAIDLAEGIRSTRVLDRFEPFQSAAHRYHPGHSDLRDVGVRIATLRTR